MKSESTRELSRSPEAVRHSVFDWSVVDGRRILVLGIGGGCDIVSAYALSTLIPRTGDRKVYIGNTKGNRRFQAGLERVSENIYKLPPEGTRIDAQDRGYQFGTAKIDLRIPRGDDGITYMVRAPKKVGEMQQAAEEIGALGVDFILAVDTGGDVLKPVGDKPGRDQRMWGMLQRTSLPCLLAVVAPGVDGETHHDEMERLIRARAERGALRGSVDLAPLMPLFERLKDCYGKNRTPNLILQAWRGQLASPRPGWVTIPRHNRPAVPRAWMRWVGFFSS